MNIMSSINEINDICDWFEPISFRFRPKSLEPLEKGRLLAIVFDDLSDSDRQTVVRDLQKNMADKFFALSAFMAEHAIDTKDPSWIKAALVLHIIENFRTDYRENIRYLVLIAYAAKKIGADLSKTVGLLLPLTSERARLHLKEFISRNDELNNLKSAGVKEIKTDGATRFDPIE